MTPSAGYKFRRQAISNKSERTGMVGRGANVPEINAEEILDGIKSWVEIETPSTDGEAVNVLVSKVAGDLAALGATVERIPGRDGYGDHIRARSPWGGDGPGILLVSHLDTVWAKGTSSASPSRSTATRSTGPASTT
jgi:acetylornithine deacetylase/succinyl-diaminopimelate desuccinylase-like protein